MIRKVLEMTDRNEIRKAHEIVDKIYPLHEREALRKFLPPRPEVTFGEAIQALRGRASEDDIHLWGIIGHLERLEKSYSETPVVESEAHPFKDVPATKPAGPEFLETEADYQKAPDGTITACGDTPPWHKYNSRWESVPVYDSQDNKGMSRARRRVLRWGWGWGDD